MKKIYLILFLSISMVLCLFGCNAPAEQNNDELNDKQVENQEISNNEDLNENDCPLEEPAPIILVTNEADKQLAELYIKNLYNYVITTVHEACYMDWFHMAETTKSSDFSMSDIKAFAYCIDYFIHVYDGGSDWAFCYDIEDMQATVDRVLGPGVIVDTSEWQAGGNVFVYEDRLLRFGGEPAYGGDYPVEKIFGYFGKYEIDSDYLYIYDRVLFCTHDRWGTGIIKFYSDINKTEDSYVNEFQVGSYLPQDFSNDEALEQYGAEYKHTFKLAEDGSGYYWVSSEPVK